MMRQLSDTQKKIVLPFLSLNRWMDGNITQLRLFFSDNNNTKKYPADRRRKKQTSLSLFVL
jgi:hypothetical protein